MADIDAIKSGALKVQIKCETDYPALPFGSNPEMFAMVELVAPKFEEETRKTRAPIDLVTVIDVSGSMSGEKIELVRATLLFMVDQLKADDRLSIITFESNVHRLTELSALTPENKKIAKAAIQGMRATGGTNLSGGLLDGLQVLADRKIKNAVASCFLFTDGQPSTGIRDAPSLLRVAKAVTDKIDAVVGVSTFGFGTDHDANLLRGIAEGSNGMFYFVASEEDISQAFADSLGGLLSVVAQNLDLELQTAPNVVIKELQVTYSYDTVEPGRKYRFKLKDLYSEEKRDLVLRLQVGALTAETASQPLLNAALTYFNVLLPGKETSTGEMTVKRPATCTLGDPNPLIEAQRNRIEVARAIHVALEAGKRGDYASGQKAIDEAQQRIKACKGVPPAASANLLKDLDEAKAELSNKSAYAQGGAQKMMSKLSAHQQQRSNISSPMYSNACQVATKASYAMGIQQQMPPQMPQQMYGYPVTQQQYPHPPQRQMQAPLHAPQPALNPGPMSMNAYNPPPPQMFHANPPPNFYSNNVGPRPNLQRNVVLPPQPQQLAPQQLAPQQQVQQEVQQMPQLNP